jgi:hexosaminidase
MAPSPDLYLDHLQGNSDDEPPGRPDTRTLADIYAFEPVPADMPPQVAAHVLGAEAALWTEHMRTEARVEHAAFPRLDALAEVLWSPSDSRDWRGFIARLVAEMNRQRALGVVPAESAFEVRTAETYDGANDRVAVSLSDQVGFPIRYTIGGGEPDASAPAYSSALDLPLPSTLHAAVFFNDRRIGPSQVRAFTRETALQRSSAALKQCTGKLILRLEDDAPANAPRAIFDVDLFNPCWLWENAPLDRIGGIAVQVGQLPYNFQLAHDIANVVPRPVPSSAEGELQVKLDSCEGATIAKIPLHAAIANPALTTLSASWPPVDGAHDLCFEFSANGNDQLWAIDRVQLVPLLH